MLDCAQVKITEVRATLGTLVEDSQVCPEQSIPASAVGAGAVHSGNEVDGLGRCAASAVEGTAPQQSDTAVNTVLSPHPAGEVDHRCVLAIIETNPNRVDEELVQQEVQQCCTAFEVTARVHVLSNVAGGCDHTKVQINISVVFGSLENAMQALAGMERMGGHPVQSCGGESSTVSPPSHLPGMLHKFTMDLDVVPADFACGNFVETVARMVGVIPRRVMVVCIMVAPRTRQTVTRVRLTVRATSEQTAALAALRKASCIAGHLVVRCAVGPFSESPGRSPSMGESMGTTALSRDGAASVVTADPVVGTQVIDARDDSVHVGCIVHGGERHTRTQYLLRMAQECDITDPTGQSSHEMIARRFLARVLRGAVDTPASRVRAALDMEAALEVLRSKGIKPVRVDPVFIAAQLRGCGWSADDAARMQATRTLPDLYPVCTTLTG